MPWFSAGIQTNPAAAAVLADTGALAVGGRGAIKIILGANVAIVCTIEHRNAANLANVNSQTIAVGANQVLDLDLPGLDWVAGERFRVTVNVAVVGSAHASIFTYSS